jgi:hypothetical protein
VRIKIELFQQKIQGKMQNLVLNDSSLSEWPDVAGKTFYKINVRGNKLTQIPRLDCHVLKIDARKNMITVLPDVWPPTIEVLDLGFNYIHESAFLDMVFPPALKELWLNSNLLFHFPANLPSSLEFLSIENNRILEIFADQIPKQIEIFFCSACGIKILPPLNQFERLTKLDLGYNNLTEIPEMPPNLLELYLNNNQLINFPSSLPPKLHHIDLARNKLRNLKTIIQSSLTVINLSYNQIDDVSIALNMNSQLCSINLSHNWLTKEPIILQRDIRRRFVINVNRNWLDQAVAWNQLLVARRFQTIMWIKFCRIIARTQRIKEELLATAMHPSRWGNF